MLIKDDFPSFGVDFDNLHIYIDKLRIQRFNYTLDSFEPPLPILCNVWESVKIHKYIDKIEIVGDIFLMVKSQGEKHETVLFMETALSASEVGNKEVANIFCKLIHYLFEWLTTYVSENDIKDDTGEDFKVPLFPYAQVDFEKKFPPHS